MLKGEGILTNLQQAALKVFSRLPDSADFYLTGGTALSEFYFRHRLSFDLDFFTSKNELIVPFSLALEGELQKNEIAVTVVHRFHTFVEFVLAQGKDQTKIHLGFDSPFRFSPTVDSEYGVKVSNYQDIIIDKLLAFFGRAEPRDAIDLFFILKKEDVWKLLAMAPQKDPGFELYWFAMALEKVGQFPDNITQWPVAMLVEIDIKELKDMFVTLSQKVMGKIREAKT